MDRPRDRRVRGKLVGLTGEGGAHRLQGASAAPGLYFLAAMVLGFGVDIYVTDAPALPRWLVTPAGPASTASGVLLLAVSLLSLKLSGTTMETSRTPARLVTHGPYRFSRNPAYLGLTLTCAGLSLWGDCLWAAVLVPVAALLLDRLVVRREEESLARRFGSGYEEYRKRVRRWI